MRACRLDGQLVRIGVPHHRVDHRSIDAGGVHGRQRFILQKRRLPVMGGWRAFGPEVDLCVNNHHGGWLSYTVEEGCGRASIRHAER